MVFDLGLLPRVLSVTAWLALVLLVSVLPFSSLLVHSAKTNVHIKNKNAMCTFFILSYFINNKKSIKS